MQIYKSTSNYSPNFQALKFKNIRPEHVEVLKESFANLKNYARNYDIVIKSGRKTEDCFGAVGIPIKGLHVTVSKIGTSFFQKLFQKNGSASRFYPTEFRGTTACDPDIGTTVSRCISALKK